MATSSAAATMCEMSGSLDFPSGVGTQMMMASAAPRARTPCGDRQPPRPDEGRRARRSGRPSIELWPRAISDSASASASAPITGVPAFGKGHGQRKPDVAEPDDTDRRVAALEPLRDPPRPPPRLRTAALRSVRRHGQASLCDGSAHRVGHARTSSSRLRGSLRQRRAPRRRPRAALGKARVHVGHGEHMGRAGTGIG